MTADQVCEKLERVLSAHDPSRHVVFERDGNRVVVTDSLRWPDGGGLVRMYWAQTLRDAIEAIGER